MRLKCAQHGSGQLLCLESGWKVTVLIIRDDICYDERYHNPSDIVCTFTKNVGFTHCTKTRHVYYAVYGFNFVIDEYIRHVIYEYED